MPHLSTARTFGSLRVRTPMAVPGMRIGVMGGTFNPPHSGHLVVAASAMKRLQLDAVWWLVTPGNPLKVNGGLPPIEARMAACRALARHPRMHVTAFEAELGAPYTAVTTAFLARRHRGVRFVWLMGADNLAGFHRWQNWRGIAATMPIAVVDRPNWRLKAVSSPAAAALARTRWSEARARGLTSGRLWSGVSMPRPGWVLLSTRLSPESSTELRARVEARVEARVVEAGARVDAGGSAGATGSGSGACPAAAHSAKS
ncbi:MAG: nicotinate-nucleotide adenylyltransferase [Hyphomicrobium aestuarii]|nr:nicotinate-nucleotide adenylyltransferase [Hyphomicrobium aestuarii]